MRLCRNNAWKRKQSNTASTKVKLDRTVSDGQGSVQSGEISNETCLEGKADSENDQSHGVKHVQDMHTHKKPETYFADYNKAELTRKKMPTGTVTPEERC